MKSVVVFFFIISALFAAWLLNKWLQKITRPRESFYRLLLYILSALLMMFFISFLMVFIIGQFYPGELMK